MKYIELTKGYRVIVDDDDYDYLVQFKWHSVKKGDNVYAQRSIKRPKRSNISMHRCILKAEPGTYVDHINGITLDNRKENLRVCTNQQNSFNSKKQKISKNKYKGVKKNKNCSTWSARITHNGVTYYLGSYKNEELAAKAYNRAATVYFTNFARLNEVI